MKEEIERYLAILGDHKLSPDARLSSLVFALDDLIVAYNRTLEGRPATEDREPPPKNYQEYVKLIRESFPQLGKYPSIDPKLSLDQEITVSDAVDDLADIAGDLSEVLWRLDHAGEKEAQWYFRFLYTIHWGRHLHDLRRYLFALIHE